MIRLAANPDRSAIADLHTRSWQASYGGVLPADYMAHDLPRDMAIQWADRVLNDATRLTLIDDGLRGFIHVFTDRSPAYIDNLHVAPKVRSSGIGAALLAQARARCGPCALTVLAQNHRAIAFYTREGGVLGERVEEALFGNPVTALKVRFD